MQPIFETLSRFKRGAKGRGPRSGQPPPEGGAFKAGKNGGYRERGVEIPGSRARVKVSLSQKPQPAAAPWALDRLEAGHHA
jgi:hypothetical protein